MKYLFFLVFAIGHIWACPELENVYCNITKCYTEMGQSPSEPLPEYGTCIFDIYAKFSDGSEKNCVQGISCANTVVTSMENCTNFNGTGNLCWSYAEKVLYSCVPDCKIRGHMPWQFYAGIAIFGIVVLYVFYVYFNQKKEPTPIDIVEYQPAPVIDIKHTRIPIPVEDSTPMDISCKLCFVNKSDTVLQPCGHFLLCSLCAEKVKNCPICRSEINNLVPVYTS